MCFSKSAKLIDRSILYPYLYLHLYLYLYLYLRLSQDDHAPRIHNSNARAGTSLPLDTAPEFTP